MRRELFHAASVVDETAGEAPVGITQGRSPARIGAQRVHSGETSPPRADTRNEKPRACMASLMDGTGVEPGTSRM